MPRGGRRPGAGRKPGIPDKALSGQRIELAALAQSYAPQALTVLAELMADASTPAAARVSSASVILDRGYGKPAQAIHHQGHDGGPVQVVMSPADSALCYGKEGPSHAEQDAEAAPVHGGRGT